MDKSAKKFAGLALGSFCLALVGTTQGTDQPKPAIPKAPAWKKPAPVLTPPPAKRAEKQLAAFAEEFLHFSPELYRVVMGSEIRGNSRETTHL